ncbi:hypothetical protein Asi03nite_58290 [Actinoplanes siamensis]|uniref:Uncharacterized protein n=1 Tax=Actinoplanes siamensis TaxID=1223317 RepID=A0A919NBY6_9ACTN|nr:hypothetical protein Asi03nite_58290 [Actinoplanes siamensis]
MTTMTPSRKLAARPEPGAGWGSRRTAGRMEGRAARVGATLPAGAGNQTAVQLTAGTEFVPVQEPRKPKDVLAPAPRPPL